MRKFKKIKLMIALGFGILVMINAQSNFLWIQDGHGESGTGGNPIGVVLANEENLLA